MEEHRNQCLTSPYERDALLKHAFVPSRAHVESSRESHGLYNDAHGFLEGQRVYEKRSRQVRPEQESSR